MYSEIKDIVAAGATVNVDKTAGVAIVTWWVSISLNDHANAM